MKLPSTLPLFNWPVERRRAIGVLGLASLATLTLLAVGILACAKVGSLRHLSMGNLKLIFALSLLLGLIDVAAIRKAYRFDQRKYLLQAVQSLWNRMEKCDLTLQGAQHLPVDGVGSTFFVVKDSLVFTMERFQPDGMEIIGWRARTPPPEPPYSRARTPLREEVWPYLPWLRPGKGEFIVCSLGFPYPSSHPQATLESLKLFQTSPGVMGIQEVDDHPPGLSPVSLAELQRRALLGDSSSLFESIIDNLVWSGPLSTPPPLPSSTQG